MTTIFVTAETIKPLSEALLSRLNAMGVVSKVGKPLVVDQAYELLAALAGYRNQHILRDALKRMQCTPPRDAAAGNADCAARSTPQAVDPFVFRQGLLQRFGYRFECDLGLDTWVVTLAGVEQDRTARSKREAVDMAWDDVVIATRQAQHISGDAWDALSASAQRDIVSGYLQTAGWSPDIIPQLKAAGYSLSYSEVYKRPFWECEYQASEDFDTEEQAWMDAWRHAKENFVTLKPVPQAQSPMEQAVREQVSKAGGDEWGEHPHYTRQAWCQEVDNRDTHLGYWEWVVHQVEANGGDEEHCEQCGAPLDGESYDGSCGDCADRMSCERCGERLPDAQEGGCCPDCTAEKGYVREPQIDRATHTSYSFSLGALTRVQLEDECADHGVPFEGVDSAELRAELLEQFDRAVSRVADEAVADYDFGDGFTFAARAGWTRGDESGYTVLRAAVFLEDVNNPGAPSTRKMLTLRIHADKLLSAELS